MARGTDSNCSETVGVQPKRPRGRPRKIRAMPPPSPPVPGIPADAKVDEVPLSEIDFENTALEFRIEKRFNDLVEDIRRNGQQVPVVLRPTAETGKYQIVCGFRRCRALKALGWPTVAAFVRRDLNDDAAYTLSFLENDKRKNLNLLDKSHAVCLLRLQNKSDVDIRTIYGISQRTLERYGQISNIPEQLREAVHGSRISTTHCLVLMKAYTARKGDLDLEAWIERAYDEGLSTRELEKALAETYGLHRQKKGVELLPEGGFRITMTFNPNTSSPEDRALLRERLTEALKMLE
jgi:ParB family transcriptional regulator, chromosome partitioning protein